MDIELTCISMDRSAGRSGLVLTGQYIAHLRHAWRVMGWLVLNGEYSIIRLGRLLLYHLPVPFLSCLQLTLLLRTLRAKGMLIPRE